MNNPVRRSRRIGLTQGGRVKAGRAQEKYSRVFSQDIWTRLSEDNQLWKVLKENPSRNYFHPCTGDDYHSVLQVLPSLLTDCVRAIVLRRLPRLDEKLCIEARRKYLCVIMNAFPSSLSMRWFGLPGERTVRHYAPWCNRWEHDQSGSVLQWNQEEVRRYYLYHLFLHEIGHLNQPSFGSRKRREAFAENFALEWARKLGHLWA